MTDVSEKALSDWRHHGSPVDHSRSAAGVEQGDRMQFESDPEVSGFSAQALEGLLADIEAGRPDLHDGWQLYISRDSRPVVDAAGGEARAGTAMQPDTLTLWFSSSKPITATAVAILWERGLVSLDDRIRRYIPDFMSGKEEATIRHVLTHRGGFPFADLAGMPATWNELVEQVVGSPALHEPGAAAVYHATAGWVALGALVEAVDGRRIDRFVEEEIFGPLGMTSCHLGIPPDRLEELRDRVAHIGCKLPEGHPLRPVFDLPHLNTEAGLRWISPGGCGRGPARELGRFYEMILGRGERDGVRILSEQTVEAITSVHRLGVVDHLASIGIPHPKWGDEPPWGLGFIVQGADFGPRASFRSVGHSGHSSSTAFCDPEYGLVVSFITNGLPGFEKNIERMRSVTDAIYAAAGIPDPGDSAPPDLAAMFAQMEAIAGS